MKNEKLAKVTKKKRYKDRTESMVAEKPREKKKVSRRKSLSVKQGPIKFEYGSPHLEIEIWVTCTTTTSVESLDRMRVKAMIINCSFKGFWL